MTTWKKEEHSGMTATETMKLTASVLVTDAIENGWDIDADYVERRLSEFMFRAKVKNERHANDPLIIGDLTMRKAENTLKMYEAFAAYMDTLTDDDYLAANRWYVRLKNEAMREAKRRREGR